MPEEHTPVTVRLPSQLRHYWGGPDRVEAAPGTLADVLRALDAAHPGLASRVLDEQGRVRPHVLVFVNGAPAQHAPPATVPVRAGDEVRILPAVSGGQE